QRADDAAEHEVQQDRHQRQRDDLRAPDVVLHADVDALHDRLQAGQLHRRAAGTAAGHTGGQGVLDRQVVLDGLGAAVAVQADAGEGVGAGGVGGLGGERAVPVAVDLEDLLVVVAQQIRQVGGDRRPHRRIVDGGAVGGGEQQDQIGVGGAAEGGVG